MQQFFTIIFLYFCGVYPIVHLMTVPLCDPGEDDVDADNGWVVGVFNENMLKCVKR